MLPRVLEPEAMDSVQEAVDYDSMDHRDVNRRFVDDLLTALGLGVDDVEGEVLDLGTGTGQIPIELCRRGDYVCVRAVDLAASMLDVARLNVELAALGRRIFLQQVDAKRLPFSAGQFPVVMSNSIVHHIPEPRAVLAEAVRVTAPGGWLFFRDLLRPDDEATVEHMVALYAAEANGHQRQMFADSLRAALTLEEIQSLVAELGFAPATVQATSDRHWTWIARR